MSFFRPVTGSISGLILSLLGGRTITVESPLKKLPLFVKAGSIIPMAPVMKYSDEYPLDTLFVHVYPNMGAGSKNSFVMYEDDGKSQEYRSGTFMTTTFRQESSVTDEGNILSVSVQPSSGTFAGQVKKRIYLFTIHQISSLPKSVNLAAGKISTQKNISNLRKFERAYYYEKKKNSLMVQITAAAAERVELNIEFSQGK